MAGCEEGKSRDVLAGREEGGEAAAILQSSAAAVLITPSRGKVVLLRADPYLAYLSRHY